MEKNRIQTPLGLGIRNIHAKDHDNQSRRLDVIKRYIDKVKMSTAKPKTEALLLSVNS